jgi:hypothetical protein
MTSTRIYDALGAFMAASAVAAAFAVIFGVVTAKGPDLRR